MVLRARGVRFISFHFPFHRAAVRLREKRRKSTLERKKIKNSRSMTTRERSSVQSVRSSVWRGTRGKSKKQKLPGLVCVVE